MKLYYATMTGSRPPKIKMFVNAKENAADNYMSFLKRQLRGAFELTGVPLILEAVPRPKKVESIKRNLNSHPRKRK